jgi:hypothetical protein
LDVPRKYYRHLIARRLGRLPWELDDVPQFEIEHELQMLSLEDEVQGAG